MRLEVGSGWAPGGLCVGSVRSPMRFGVGSWWAPGGLRALSHAVWSGRLRGLHALSCTGWSGGMQFWGGFGVEAL